MGGVSATYQDEPASKEGDEAELWSAKNVLPGKVAELSEKRRQVEERRVQELVMAYSCGSLSLLVLFGSARLLARRGSHRTVAAAFDTPGGNYAELLHVRTA